MGNFDRNNNSGGGRFGRREFGGDRGGDRERPQMHHAVCSSCGKACQLPFRPSGDRPVYCSDCFAKTTGSEPRRSFGGGDRGGDRRDDRGSSRPPFRQFDNDTSGKSLRKLQFEALNEKLDKILKLLLPNTPQVSNKSTKIERKVVEVQLPQEEVIEVAVVTPAEPAKKTKAVAKKKKAAKKVSKVSAK